MSFQTMITITPDPDGVHCGECRHRPEDLSPWCLMYRQWTLGIPQERCPACLAAEKASRMEHVRQVLTGEVDHV